MTPLQRARAAQIMSHKLQELLTDSNDLMHEAAKEARESGSTMGEIATALFVSRQALYGWGITK